MAYVQSPSGQMVLVPDDLAGTLGLGQTDPGIAPPIAGLPDAASTGEVGQGVLPSAFGGGVPIAPQPQVTLPIDHPASPMAPVQTEQPNPLAIPAPMPAAPVEMPSTLRPEMTDPKAIKARGVADKKAVAQAAQQAAYAASPEGQIAESERQLLESNQRQQQLQDMTAAVAVKEADELAGLKRAGEATAEEIRLKNEERETAYRAGVAAKSSEVQKAVDAEANYKIDDNRLWHNRTTGQKILAGISVALSGLGQALAGKGGDPNLAYGIITGAIKDDVNAQIRERDQLGKRINIKRDSLDSYRKLGAEEREAGALKLAEQYNRVARQIDVASSGYASDKAKLAAANVSEQLRADAAKIVGQYGEAAYNRDVKKREMAMQQQSINISGGHLALAGKQFEYGKAKDAIEFKLRAAELDNAREVAAAKAKAAKGDKEAEEWLKRGISGTAVPIKDRDGNTVDVEYKPLTQKDGTRWIPTGSEGAVDKLRNEKVATDRLIQIMDQVLSSGPEWLSDSKNSDKLQEMKADWNAAMLEVKDVKQLGVLAGPDLEMIGGFLGTSDPTRYKDSVAGIKRARKNLVNGMNIRMRAHDFTGTYDPPQIGSVAAGDSAPERDLKASLSIDANPGTGSAVDRVLANAVRIAKTGSGQAKRDAINTLMTLRFDSKSGPVRQAAIFSLDELGIEPTTGMPKGFGTPGGIPAPQAPPPTKPSQLTKPQILGVGPGGMQIVRMPDGSTKAMSTQDAAALVSGAR